MRPGMNGAPLRLAASRAAALALVWWILSEGAATSWMVGVPVVLAAVWISLRLAPAALPIAPLAALAFFGYFLLHSIKGGLQVAAFALRPHLALEPVELELPLRLPSGAGQMLLTLSVSLMPGTLAVGLEHGRLRLHVLDRHLEAEEGVRATEAHIARMLKLRMA